jgi:hypothetical protein
MTDKLADAAATQAVEEELYEEFESQATTHKCELILKQTNSILDAVSQRVSFMKQDMQKDSNTSSVPLSADIAKDVFTDTL